MPEWLSHLPAEAGLRARSIGTESCRNGCQDRTEDEKGLRAVGRTKSFHVSIYPPEIETTERTAVNANNSQDGIKDRICSSRRLGERHLSVLDDASCGT